MPTTNPVPSTDPTDLLFNAGKLDEVVNGTANSFTDRLGVERRTVAGMNADFDAQLADAESDLNVYRSDAAASAAEALGYLQTIRATSYGAYASDPATDPLGNPPTVGDEYFNTTANLLKRWNGTTWQASDINTANLAAPSGSSLVGYDGGTVQDVLDGAKSLQDYTALRAYTGSAKRIYITGLLATVKPSGIAGSFQHDPTDTTSSDNGGTIIVGSDGRRWKRDYVGYVYAAWFGAVGNGSTNDQPAIQNAINFTAIKGGTVRLEGTHYIETSLTPKSKVNIVGSVSETLSLTNVGTSIKVKAGVTAFNIASGYIDDCIIENITIFCADVSGGGDAFKFADSTHWRNSALKRVAVRNMDRAINLVSNVDWQVVLIENCLFAAQLKEHVYYGPNTSSGAIHYLGTRFEQTASGYSLVNISAASAMENRFTSCVIEGCSGQYAIRVASNAGVIAFNGCHFESNGIGQSNGADVYVGSGRGAVYFDDCSFSGPASTATAFSNVRLISDSTHRVTFIGCVFNLNTTQVPNYLGVVYEPRGGKFVTAIGSAYFGNAISQNVFWANCKNAVRVNDSSVSANGIYLDNNVNSITTSDASYTTIWGTSGYTFEIAKVGTYFLTAKVQCISSDGLVYGTWVRRAVITTSATNVATIRGYLDQTPVTTGGTLDVRFTLTGNGIEGVGVNVEVCGVAATNIKWHSVVEHQYVTYA